MARMAHSVASQFWPQNHWQAVASLTLFWDPKLHADGVPSLQAASDALISDAGGKVADVEGYGGRSFGDKVFGNPLGKGAQRQPLSSLYQSWNLAKESCIHFC